MRKVFGLVLAALVAAPAYAASPIYTITPVAGASASRPAVNASTVIGPQIVWGNSGTATAGKGSRYTALVGPEVNVAPYSFVTGWSAWAIEVGVSANYAVYGGPPADNAMPIQVERLSDGAIISIATDGIPDDQDNNHFTDVTDSGLVFWGSWDNTIKMCDVSSGTAGPIVTVMSTPLGNPGWRFRVATESDRVAVRMDNSGAPSPIDMYDVSDNAIYNVITPAVVGAWGTQKPMKAEMSADGNWVLSNVRYTAVGGNMGDLVLVDVSNPAAPVQYNLTNNPDRVRNDPAISILDADTALVVWDENASGTNDVVGAYLTGLNGGTPTLGTQFVIADGTDNQHYADVDGLLVAWKNDTAGKIQYTIIPEPASLALLALGGLALARRR